MTREEEEEKRQQDRGEALEEEVIEEEHDQEYDHRDVRNMLDPKLPSQAEVQQHNLNHLPYRNWCHHCVKGRGKEMDHRTRKDEEESGIPEYLMDYFFQGTRTGRS